jgi:hypothetical protein
VLDLKGGLEKRPVDDFPAPVLQRQYRPPRSNGADEQHRHPRTSYLFNKYSGFEGRIRKRAGGTFSRLGSATIAPVITQQRCGRAAPASANPAVSSISILDSKGGLEKRAGGTFPPRFQGNSIGHHAATVWTSSTGIREPAISSINILDSKGGLENTSGERFYLPGLCGDSSGISIGIQSFTENNPKNWYKIN